MRSTFFSESNTELVMPFRLELIASSQSGRATSLGREESPLVDLVDSTVSSSSLSSLASSANSVVERPGLRPRRPEFLEFAGGGGGVGGGGISSAGNVHAPTWNLQKLTLANSPAQRDAVWVRSRRQTDEYPRGLPRLALIVHALSKVTHTHLDFTSTASVCRQFVSQMPVRRQKAWLNSPGNSLHSHAIAHNFTQWQTSSKNSNSFTNALKVFALSSVCCDMCQGDDGRSTDFASLPCEAVSPDEGADVVDGRGQSSAFSHRNPAYQSAQPACRAAAPASASTGRSVTKDPRPARGLQGTTEVALQVCYAATLLPGKTSA